MVLVVLSTVKSYLHDCLLQPGNVVVLRVTTGSVVTNAVVLLKDKTAVRNVASSQFGCECFRYVPFTCARSSFTGCSVAGGASKVDMRDEFIRNKHLMLRLKDVSTLSLASSVEEHCILCTRVEPKASCRTNRNSNPSLGYKSRQ